MSSAIMEQISAGASAIQLQRMAITQGMRALRDVALDHVRKGETSLEELERVLGDAIDDSALVALQPPRVLLADDDPMVRHLATSILESGGYRVRQARDGVEAMSIIDAGEDVALVVTDLRMPGLGGDGLVQQLRSRVQTAMLPIIVLTGSDEYDTEVKLMDAGADDYIRKPIDPPRFLARVKAALRRAGVS